MVANSSRPQALPGMNCTQAGRRLPTQGIMFLKIHVHPRLKETIAGRCGFMASVLRNGTIRPGMTIYPMHVRSASVQVSSWADKNIMKSSSVR